EVVQVAEKFIEAVHGGKELVQVTEMVLAELPGGVALRLEGGGERDGLRRDANICTRLTNRCQSGADRQFAGYEVGAARRAARFGVVVGEPHAFGREPVEVRRLP